MSDESERDDHSASDHGDFEDSEEYDSDESASEATNHFLDMEAEESDGPSDDGDSDDSEPCLFPQFSRLPIELRHRVWEFFDPDLKSKARVLEFHLNKTPQVHFTESAHVAEQTAPARAMLATHHESRDLALKSYPHTFQLSRRGDLARFNSDQDVILLSSSGFLTIDDLHAAARFMGDAKFLAVDTEYGMMPETPTYETVEQMAPNLKVIYICSSAEQFNSRVLRWCTTDLVHNFHVQTWEQEPGLGEDLEYMYCWPNLKEHEEFAEKTLQSHEEQTHLSGVPVWPMHRFSFRSGLERFYDIQDRDRQAVMAKERSAIPERNDKPESERKLSYGVPDPYFLDSESDRESASSEEVDDYEIDDFVVDSTPEGSVVTDDDDNDSAMGHPIDEDSPSAFDRSYYGPFAGGFGGFSPLNDENSAPMEGNNYPAGRFSRLEGGTPSEDGLDQSTPEQEERPRPAKRTRIILSDSEDELAGQEDMPAKPAKRARVVLSDSEDEDDDEPIKPGRAARYAHVVLSGSDSESDDTPEDRDYGDVPEEEVSTQEDSEEDDDDAEEELSKAKPMSLLKRLRQFRSEHPVPPSGSDDDSVTYDGDNDDFLRDTLDGDGVLKFQDDEHDTERFDEAEDRLIAGMAEEGNDEGEYDDDGW